MKRLLVPIAAAMALVVTQAPASLSSAAAELVPAATQSASIPVERIAGTDRYKNAAAVSEAWSSGVSRVYVVSGTSYSDALVASSRAGIFNAPVLFTQQDSVPAVTRNALQRLSPGRIVVIGGTDSVSAGVLEELRSYSGSEGVRRIAESDRYRTAARVAQQYWTNRSAAILVNGTDYPNASVAALAAHREIPVLLTPGGSLDSLTRRVLDRLQVGEIIVVGDSAAVTDEVARRAASTTSSGTYRRISGGNQYEISAAIAREFPTGGDPVYVSSGYQYHGALVGAALAGRDGVPLILSGGERVFAATQEAMDRQQPASVTVIGPENVISSEVVNQLVGGESEEPDPAPEPTPGDSVSTGVYNGMRMEDDANFLNLVGEFPLTHATSYYTSGEVDSNWPRPRDWQRKSDGVIVQMGMASKNYLNRGDGSYMAWRDIAAGRHDEELRTWGRKLAAFDHEVWFAFDIEPDVKLNQGHVPTNWTPEEYAAAAQRISRIVRSEAPKVKYTFWVGGHQKGLIDRMYPGDDSVDIICWDPYVHRAKSPDTTPYELWSSFDTWLDGRSWGQGKTRGLCETGFHNGHPDSKGAAFWQQAPEAARRLDLAFVTYFHRNSGPDGYYTMENMPQTRQAYAQAMRELND